MAKNFDPTVLEMISWEICEGILPEYKSWKKSNVLMSKKKYILWEYFQSICHCSNIPKARRRRAQSQKTKRDARNTLYHNANKRQMVRSATSRCLAATQTNERSCASTNVTQQGNGVLTLLLTFHVNFLVIFTIFPNFLPFFIIWHSC